MAFPVDTGRKLNAHKTFRRRPGRLLNVLCTFNLRPVSTGFLLRENIILLNLRSQTLIVFYWIKSRTKPFFTEPCNVSKVLSLVLKHLLETLLNGLKTFWFYHFFVILGLSVLGIFMILGLNIFLQ